MSWSQSYVTIRLIDLGWAGQPVTVRKPFTAYEITSDACACSSARWIVQADCDSQPVTYPWYAILTADDNHHARVAKWSYARTVRNAQDQLRAAQRELARLTG
jgi:hypothetical protein